MDISASSSGGSVFGTGDSIAGSGMVATNVLNGQVEASIENATGRRRQVARSATSRSARPNDMLVDVENRNAMTSGAESYVFSIALNSMGWENVLGFLGSTLRTLFGGFDLEQAGAELSARITDSAVISTGTLTVEAAGRSELSAFLSNSAATATAAFMKAAARSFAGVLSGNYLASQVEGLYRR